MKKIHFPHLDSLRFLAFAGVFMHHMFFTESESLKANALFNSIDVFFSFGKLGVNFFFVLSGFLITYLLLVEEERNSQIRIGAFYLRRVLRIWPLFYACLFFAYVIYPLLMNTLGLTPVEDTSNPWLTLTFLNNFDQIYNGIPPVPGMMVLWSVGIEEQFYLLWPLLLVYGKQIRPYIFIGIILIATIFRWQYFDQERVVYMHSLSVMSDLAIGGGIGWLAYHKQGFINWFKALKRRDIILIYLLGLIFIFTATLGKYYPSPPLAAFHRLFLSMFFAFVILEQIYAKTSFWKAGNYKWMEKWGKYTYGLYCLHTFAIFPVVILFRKLGLDGSFFIIVFVEPVLAMLGSMFMAYISYHSFEKHFLKLKNRFSFV